MRILLSLSWYLPWISGLTLSLDCLAKQLAGAGHDVTVLAGCHEPALARSETLAQVKVRRVPVMLRLGKALFMPMMLVEGWREVGKAQIVHLWLPQFDAGPLALFARLRGKPVLLNYNCSLTSPGLIGGIAVAAVNTSHLLAAICAQRIVANSEDYARQSRLCRMFWRKLEIVNLPIPGWPDSPGRYNAPQAPYTIGFLGRFSREKGLETLVAAIPHLRRDLGTDFNITLAGPSQRPSTGPLADLLRAAPKEMTLKWQLTDDERDAFLRGLDLLVVPSTDRIEAFGLVQLEAMLRGVPVVASDRPGIRIPIQRTGFGRLFHSGDAEDLARAISETLVAGPEECRSPTEIGEMFDNQATRQHYEAIYRDLLGQALT